MNSGLEAHLRIHFAVLFLLCVLKPKWREHKVSYLWAVLGVWRKSSLIKRSLNTLYSDFISWFISLRPNLTHLKTPLLWKRLLFYAVTKEALSFVKVLLRFVSTSEYIFYYVVGNSWSWRLESHTSFQPVEIWGVSPATTEASPGQRFIMTRSDIDWWGENPNSHSDVTACKNDPEELNHIFYKFPS